MNLGRAGVSGSFWGRHFDLALRAANVWLCGYEVRLEWWG
jgi:hypothetical protein